VARHVLRFRWSRLIVLLASASCAGGSTSDPSARSPVVTSVVPVSGSTNGGTPISVAGAGFDSAASLTFDGIPATGVVVTNDTTIMARTPAHAAGSVDVRVRNPDGTSGVLSRAYQYIIAVITTPTLTSPNEIHLFGNWRVIYVDGDADDFWIYTGATRHRENDGFTIPVSDSSSTGWSLRFEYEGTGTPAPVMSIMEVDLDNFNVTVRRETPGDPKDLLLKLQRF
jgi:hypothetical protein